MASNWRDAIKVGAGAGGQKLRGGFEGLGWFMIFGTPVLYVLQEVGVFSGPKASTRDVIGGIGLVLVGVLLVVLTRRLPRMELGVRHLVRSERDEQRRYVPVCSCGWFGEPQETVERLLLAARDHRNVALLEPRSADY